MRRLLWGGVGAGRKLSEPLRLYLAWLHFAWMHFAWLHSSRVQAHAKLIDELRKQLAETSAEASAAQALCPGPAPLQTEPPASHPYANIFFEMQAFARTEPTG